MLKLRKFIPLFVIIAGCLSYANSLNGVFLFDDVPAVVENPSIRHLWPLSSVLSPPRAGGSTVEGRPLLNLSFAINYAVSGYRVWSYHVLNILVHILCGLTLLGILRRTLQLPKFRQRIAAPDWIACAIAILWVIHPLQAESVTYIVQRAESLVGLLYLQTLYCFIRAADSRRQARWYGLAIVACALGMATKEVMVSAPVVVFLYDAIFLTGTYSEALRRRRRFYVCLAGTWLVLAYVALPGFTSLMRTSFENTELTWLTYFESQPGVILHYIRLAFWPHRLCLDYLWPVATDWAKILPAGAAIILMIWLIGWGLKKKSGWSFLGAAFFLILAPTSSVLPLRDLAFEHRMYLPLAALLALVVCSIHWALSKLKHRWESSLFGLAACACLILTLQRNQTYRDSITMYSDVLEQRPNNQRAHNNLGIALSDQGQFAEGIQHFEKSLRLLPNYAHAENNLGLALSKLGKTADAIEHYRRAIRLDPKYSFAHNNLGVALIKDGKPEEAIAHFSKAIELRPDHAEAHRNLGNVLQSLGRNDRAQQEFVETLRLNPDMPEVHGKLGVMLALQGRLREALPHLNAAARMLPNDAEAQNNLGYALSKDGRLDAAIAHLSAALRLKPDYPEAHNNIGFAFGLKGWLNDAIPHFQEALRLKPDHAEAHYNWGVALAQGERYEEARVHFEAALRLDPQMAAAREAVAAVQRHLNQ